MINYIRRIIDMKKRKKEKKSPMTFLHSFFHTANEKNNNPIYPVTGTLIEEQETHISKDNNFYLFIFKVKSSPVLRLNLA